MIYKHNYQDNYMSFYNSKSTTKEMALKKKRHEAYQANKGNWEYSFFQKSFDPNEESNRKVLLKPGNNIDPNNFHLHINPTLSREEIIFNKNKAGQKISKTEKMMLDNWLEKRAKLIEQDVQDIKILGLHAKPVTNNGKTILILEVLCHEIKKNNKDAIANIFLRLMEDQFKITPELELKYSKELTKMKMIVDELDLIELQFTKFHSQMPPLNINGFKKFDQWQIDVVKNIDANISTVINAPTSAGKSVLSGYAALKGRTLIVVPTSALAWQMSAYIGHIIKSNVPILTPTYQTNPSRTEMIELLNKAEAIIGTADSIIDYLPFMKIDFKWMIFDEVHMIGKLEGSGMENIIKLIQNVPILALSATIGNTDEIVEWLKTISPDQPIQKIICTKRFFNLQRFYYDSDKLVCLHPFSLIDKTSFEDGTILSKSFQPTPPNIWDLSKKLSEKFELDNLNPQKYFDREERIELDKANEYFTELIKFMVEKYKTNKDEIISIISSYKHECLEEKSVNLVDLAYKLKEENKLPAIFFEKNTMACLQIVRTFAKILDKMEDIKYPKLVSDRLKQAKLADKQEKKNGGDKEDIDKNSKKEIKQMMGTATIKKDKYGESSIPVITETIIEAVVIQEPHPDFILNQSQLFSSDTVETWVTSLKRFFPNTGDEYHFIIKLLWRGIGVYAKGLPDPYLLLVQTLACKKQLAVVFSDMSLVFGVSMPFRSVVIVKNENIVDDLDSMLFQQMTGRAGRRGLDKEGNIIFAGYSWDRIKELSISEPPIIKGQHNIMYTILHANKLSELNGIKQNWDNTCTNFLDKSIDEEDVQEFIQGSKSNYEGGWSFSYFPKDINHLHMNWKLRYTDECIISSFLITYLKRAFEDKDHTQESNQVALAHFLCRFMSTIPTDNPADALVDPEILKLNPYNQILDNFEELQIEFPKMIDNKLFKSIQQNLVVMLDSYDELDKLRERLMKFGDKLKAIQHYCFHTKISGLSKIIGKLLTRIWWVYHTSSPIMKPYNTFEN
jgi:hypothetical protein